MKVDDATYEKLRKFWNDEHIGVYGSSYCLALPQGLMPDYAKPLSAYQFERIAALEEELAPYRAAADARRRAELRACAMGAL